MKLNTKIKLGALFLFGLSATPFLAGVTMLVERSNASTLTDQAKAITPFQSLTIENLPAFSTQINVQLPPEAQALLKVVKINAAIGDTPNQKMPFSIWQTAFGAGDLSPAAAASLSGTPAQIAEKMVLSNFKFLEKTSISQFVAANPQLANLSITQLPKGLLPTVIANGLTTPSTLGQMAVDALYKNSPLGNLANIKASEIQGFLSSPLKNYPAVAAAAAVDIPFVSKIPLIKFPAIAASIQAGIPLGTIDTINKGEGKTRKTISGSNKNPNAVCESSENKCDYVELLGFPRNPQMDGATIVSSDSQSLSGGLNFPGELVNGGKEPPGLLPFGDSFKLSFNQVNPIKDTVQANINLRVCWSMVFYTTCTPYFVGPIPLFQIKAGSQFPLLVGNVQVPIDTSQIISNALPVVKDLNAQINKVNDLSTAISKAPAAVNSAISNVSSTINSAISNTTASINYGAKLGNSFLKTFNGHNVGNVHSLGCEESICLAAVGVNQIRSDNFLFRQYMKMMPEGKQILERMDSGKELNPVELETIFPAQEQNSIFKKILDQHPELEQATVALSNILTPGVSWSQKIPELISPINSKLNLPKIYADAITES